MTIKNLIQLKESEDKIEFKEASRQYSYNSGRRSVLGYVCALANEGGGILAFGIRETKPYTLVNSQAYLGRIGKLEQDVYRDKGIRIKVSELYDKHKNRVVIIEIPPRPIGKLFYHNDIPLMRVGDRLERMSEEMYASIVMETEPDFSAKICPGLSLDDIDKKAVEILKHNYARKQNNDAFKKLNTQQVLNDLNLITKEGITYAALILVGKEEALKRYLPNAYVNIEFRQTRNQTHFDKRETFLKPLFIGIDEIWAYLNSRNRDNKIDEGPYKFDLPYFNEEVIREAILNAIAHRDYTITSETVVKQYPDRIIFLNPGGFPKGVTIDNLIAVSSTPRSRLLTEILKKTGLVERSGQGVDKIFRITISEGKPLPDYSKTDLFQVELSIIGEIQDKAFAVFISNEQNIRDKNNQLGTFEVIALHQIKEGKGNDVDKNMLSTLEKDGIIKRVGGSASNKYTLSDAYFEIKKLPSEFGGFRPIDIARIAEVLKSIVTPKMADFIEAFKEDLTRDQVRYLIDKLTGTILDKKGSGKGTTYQLKEGVIDFNNIKDILEND